MYKTQNSDKDPGPPVCEPPFCDKGGNIDTGSLPENEVYFFHPDHLGSTSYITNINGETVQFNSYLPFGESFVSQKRTSTISNYLFNSKEVDSETGLYYYGARYYNAHISSWLSVDPIALYDPIDEVEHYLDGQHNGGYFNPRNTSVYGYTYQNPIIYVDPNGKQVRAGIILGYYGTLTALTYMDKNRCGGKCYGVGKTNFMGPSELDASKLIEKGVKPVDYMDEGAMYHDLDYESVPDTAGGAETLFNDTREEIIAADKKLLARADYVLNNKDGIDPYTKKKFTKATIARAQITHDLFTLAIAKKEATNMAEKVVDNTKNMIKNITETIDKYLDTKIKTNQKED